MDMQRFILERQDGWRRLEERLRTIDRRGWGDLAPADLESLVLDYRRAAADLAAARSRYPESPVTAYLNQLVGRAHARVYAGRPGSWRGVADFLARGFPAAVRRRWRLAAAAGVLFLIAALAGAALTARDPRLAGYFLPPAFQGVLEEGPNGGKAEQARGIADEPKPLLSSVILANNVQVAFIAFATGILAGAGTAYFVAYNGLLLGSLAAIIHGRGQGLTFWSLILPHGVLELTAIFIAAAAGFLLGGAVVDPGDLPRRDALAVRGKEAVLLLAGTLPLFAIAAAIEGFFTPLAIAPAAKLAFAALTMAGLAAYFTACRGSWPPGRR